jgi:hypothetical protein
MSDLNLEFASEDKKISIDGDKSSTGINIKEESNSSSMLGIDLLTNNKVNADLNVTNDITGGYSSDEGSIKSNKSKTNKEDYDFFSNIKEKIIGSDNDSDKGSKKIEVPIQDDPMINSIKGSESGEFKPIHSMNSQDIKNEKIDLIYKFKKLEGQGIRTTMNYNMNSPLEDMRNEYLKLKKQREIDNSVKFQRKVMMAAITGLEFLNNKFDPFDVKLDGWSESINENIYDYDEVFEELASKYGGSSEMAPEIKLLMMIGGSAFMFHLTNTMFKSSIPGMDDIMKQNPDLMKQFAQAAVGSIGKTNEQRQPEPIRTGPPPSNRNEMSGPAGLDDIMNQMNLQPGDIPDLDNISLMSGDTDRRSNSGLTLNL